MTSYLGRYLGVPILHEIIKKNTHKGIIDRMDLKLAGWKAYNLSLAGRVTLALSVLNAILAYVMQASVLPGHICREIDKSIRRWIDSRKRLIDLVPPDSIPINLEAVVADLVNSKGNWNFDLLNSLLPHEVVLHVAGMSPPRPNQGDDKLVWGLEPNDKFNIKYAYRLVTMEPLTEPNPLWRTIWNWSGQQRIHQFMWLVVHSRLLTNLMRHRRHLAKSVTTWMPLVLPSENQYFFETPLLPWITLHLKSVNAELHFGIVY
ncbi:Putative ribonuclease H protein At1g65750, partial [Linum perenne]